MEVITEGHNSLVNGGGNRRLVDEVRNSRLVIIYTNVLQHLLGTSLSSSSPSSTCAGPEPTSAAMVKMLKFYLILHVYKILCVLSRFEKT